MEYPKDNAFAHSCLLCDKYHNHSNSSKKSQLFSSLAFKRHLLSKKHLAICSRLLELKEQKKRN